MAKNSFLVFIGSIYLFAPLCKCIKTVNFQQDLHVTDDPDTYLTPPKIIRRHGYPAEAHIIESEDGYLSEYHRIPHGRTQRAVKNPYPVLLHHGLLCSSTDWIVNGPKKSLGYILADEGYDVWLANSRGNSYSRSHVTLNPTQKEFWNFTFHEVGKFDLPAAVDYVLNITNSQKLIYIGHSLGTTTFYAFLTTRPEYNSKILAHVGIAPVAMLSHTKSALKFLVPFAKKIQALVNWFSNGAFLEYDSITSVLSKLLCEKSIILDINMCAKFIIFTLFGKDVQQFNEALIPVLMSNIPAGTSVKNIVHCSQLIRSGKFEQYDYGLKGNILHYNSETPPSYNFSKITVPVKFYYGQNDILADATDVKLLYQQIPHPMGIKMIDYANWNHIDFLWAIDVNRYFNNDLVLFLRNITTQHFINNMVANAFEEKLTQSVVDIQSDGPYDRTINSDEFNEIVKDLLNYNTFSDFANTFKSQSEIDVKKVQTGASYNLNQTQQSIDNHTQEIKNRIKKIVEDIQTSFIDSTYTKNQRNNLMKLNEL